MLGIFETISALGYYNIETDQRLRDKIIKIIFGDKGKYFCKATNGTNGVSYLFIEKSRCVQIKIRSRNNKVQFIVNVYSKQVSTELN